MNPPKHILVIRLSAMGDVAMTVPVLRVLTQTYPDLQVTVLTRRQLFPLFEGITNLYCKEAEVEGAHKGIFGLTKLSKEVRKLGIDAVADLHNVIRSKVVTKLVGMKGVATATLDKGRDEKKKLTQAKGMGLVQLKSTHERYAEVFSKLGLPIDLSTHEFPKRKPLKPRINTLMGEPTKKCVGIAPFAAYESKMYPMELLRQVLAKLNENENLHVLLFGGGQNEVEQLTELATQYPNATNVAGALTFEEELNLISNLDLMVAMDSSNGHLAANFDIPVITLWGVTHPFLGFMPFNQPMENQLMANRNEYPLIPTSVYGNKFPEGYEKAMETIAPEVVLKKINQMI